MIRNENQLTSLPFYTDTKYQDRNKWWSQDVYRLVSSDNKFLPFQIIKNLTSIGGVTCPVPSSVDYTADFSSSVDGWYADSTYPILINVVHDTNRVRFDITNLNPGNAYVFTMRKVITSTRYRFNAGEIAATLDGSDSFCTLYAWAVPGYEAVIPPVVVSGGYNLNESGTGDDRRDYVAITCYHSTGADASFYLDAFESTSTPYQLLNVEEAYQSDWSGGDLDSWGIASSGTAILYNIASTNMGIHYNIDTEVMIYRLLGYSSPNIIEYTVYIGHVYTLKIKRLLIYATKRNGTPLVRFVNINYESYGGAFVYTIDNYDDIETFDSIYVVLDNTDDLPDTYFTDIHLSTLEECVEQQADLWATADLVNVKTGATTDITTYMNANTIPRDYATYQVAVYDASVNLGFTMDPEYYYIHLNDGTDDFYSEVFLPCADLSEYVKVEWWRDTDLIFDYGRIVYTDGYINTIYLDTDIGKPKYLFEVEETERDGYKFVEKVVSLKRFNFDNILPESIIDVLSRLPNHEYIMITSEDIDYRVTKIDILEADWQDVGDLAILPIEFETNTVISSGPNIEASINELMANDTEAINIRGNNKRIFQLNDLTDYEDVYVAVDKATLSEAGRISIPGIINNADKVRITSSDTTNSYLDDKITVGAEFSKAIQNPAANENILLTYVNRMYNAARTFYALFSAESLTAARTFTLPDYDGILATLDNFQVFGLNQAFAGGVWIDPLNNYTQGDGITFGSDGDSGLYQESDDRIIIFLNGTDVFDFQGNLFRAINTTGAAIVNESASGTNPTLLPSSNDLDTGVGRQANDVLSLIAGGTEEMRITKGSTVHAGQAVGGYYEKTFSATPTFNFNNGNTQQITVTANITGWAVSNQLRGGSYTIYFIISGTITSIASMTGGTQTDNSLSFDLTDTKINIVNVFVMPDGSVKWSIVETTS
jgi:hypothetical protein